MLHYIFYNIKKQQDKNQQFILVCLQFQFGNRLSLLYQHIAQNIKCYFFYYCGVVEKQGCGMHLVSLLTTVTLSHLL